jgi:hypothetical protein
MKALRSIGTIGLFYLLTVTNLMAGTGREDNSDLFVWIFLAFAALIIVAQTFPAVMLFVGMIRGLGRKKAEV